MPMLVTEHTDFLYSIEELGCKFLLSAGLVELGEIQSHKVCPVN